PRLTVYVATDADLGGAPVTVRASIADCNSLYTTCSTDVVETTTTVSTYVGNGYEELTFDFGPVSHGFGSANRRLVLRLITEDGHTLHVAFDADPQPSSIVLDLS
ncbi:MAG: hypothetical protein ACR2QK_11740, partial [Acidimicrobiales bacterium]